MNNREIRSKLYEISSIIKTKSESDNTTKYDHLYYHLSKALDELEGIMIDDKELDNDTLTDLDVEDNAFISIYDNDDDSFWGI